MVLIACAVAAAGGSNPLGNAGTTFGDASVSGFTNLQIINNSATDIGTQHDWKNVSVIGTQTATYTWTGAESNEGSQAVIATYKSAGAGGGSSFTDLMNATPFLIFQ